VRRRAQLTALASEQGVLESDLLKLRAVMLLIDLPHGLKVAKSAKLVSGLKSRGVKASLRSLYTWRRQYLKSGFAGIVRRRRRDRARFSEDLLLRVVDATTRVRKHGDIRREYRAFRKVMSYESFRVWVHRFQMRLHLVEMPAREERIGFFF
jgi:hypothetical protein